MAKSKSRLMPYVLTLAVGAGCGAYFNSKSNESTPQPCKPPAPKPKKTTQHFAELAPLPGKEGAARYAGQISIGLGGELAQTDSVHILPGKELEPTSDGLGTSAETSPLPNDIAVGLGVVAGTYQLQLN